MRLIALEVWSWRGLDHVALTDLAPDLNLVVGPNESGKSRLFEALRFALFERYKGESEDKRALRTWGSSEPPAVAVTFEARGVEWTLKKQFLKQAHARLTGGGRTLTDDDAEAKVRELWGTRAIQGRKDIEQFLGLWPLLWVRQGFATSAPHADLNDDTRARLRDALSAQVNEVATGPHGERLVARAEKERDRYWTATWKETGELAAARGRKGEADARRTEARARRAEAHGAADELSRLATELVTLEARAAAQRVRVAESRARVDKASEAGEKLHREERESARLRAENELAERVLTARRDLEGRVADLDARAAVEAEALAKVRAEEAVVAAREADEAEALARAEASLEAAHAAHVQARRRAQLEEASRRVEAARGALDRARGHHARLEEVKDRLAQVPIDDAHIKPLRKAHEGFARASAALEAASAHVVIRAARDLVVDGAALAEGDARAFPCDQPTSIVIEGVARIEVSPGGAELDRHRDAERDARRVLDGCLAEANARTLADAEEAYARRTGLVAQRAQAKVLLEEAAPAGMVALEDELRARDAEVAALVSASSGGTTEPAPSLADADEARRRASDAVTRTRAARDALKEARLGVHDQVSRRAQTLEQLAAQRSESVAALATMAAREALESGAAAARRAWLAAEDLVRALKDELTRAGGGDARIMLDQDQSALRSAEAEMATKIARRTLLEATLHVRVHASGSDDLHEQVQRAESDAEEASLALALIEPRALAVKALVEALSAARREVQERLLAPVLERVHPYLQSLLPGVRLRMDEDWSVLGLEADDQEQEFDALSGGAKEQVSILVRLALAEVLGAASGEGGGGEGLPVVLDDCLVNTDDERHADMLRILYKASRRQQVILFSCHDVPWSGLGETRRFALPARRAR